MLKLKKVHYKTKAHTSVTFVLLSGFLVALFAAAVLLITSDRGLAHQAVQTSAHTTQTTAPSSIAQIQNKTGASARDIRGASPYIAIENEPPPNQLVDANHNVFPGQVVTQTFTIPDYNSTPAH